MPTQVNNQRIAKNTLLLYGRMLLIMAVSLYTSRVVLNTLGVEDYGIYNVVGGIVTMFAFLNGRWLLQRNGSQLLPRARINNRGLSLRSIHQRIFLQQIIIKI